jgi:hypothetical protein
MRPDGRKVEHCLGFQRGRPVAEARAVGVALGVA